MKSLFSLALWFSLLYAQEVPSCYSIQLVTATTIQNTKNVKEVLKKNDCKILQISGLETLRCGCYKEYPDNTDAYRNYLELFPHSIIIRNYKRLYSTDKSTVPVTDTPTLSPEKEQFRLMYQIFVYTSDLESAYNVAKEALKKSPKSLYWYQKLAEVSQWLGKRTESIHYYSAIYYITQDKALERKLLSYSLEAYQFETAAPLMRKKVLNDPSRQNITDMIYIYDNVGVPEESLALLLLLYEKDPDIFYLKEALKISLDMGEIEEAEGIVTRISKLPFDIKTAELLSFYYFTQHDMQRSYRALLPDGKMLHDQNATNYYKQLSDLGWMMHDYENAAHASKKLFNLKQARLVDYERIIHHFTEKNPQMTLNVAQEGYEKFTKPYIFMAYLNLLMSQENYQQLAVTFKQIEKSPHIDLLKKEVSFWLIKGQMYNHFKQSEEAEFAYHRALEIEPESAEIIAAVLWFFIDNGNHKKLDQFIFDIEESAYVSSVLWLPLAVGHFQLQRSDRSLYYVKKILEKNPTDISSKFMYAYIMQVRENGNAFMQTMQEIYETLESQKNADSRLMQDHNFLGYYLKSAMYFIPSDEFEALLHRSQSILDTRSYRELLIFWSLRHDAHERGHKLAQQLAFIEPWMKLNIAMNFDNRTAQQDLLYRYYAILPIRDRVAAAIATGQISLAQTLAFEGLKANRYDYLLYQQDRDLMEANVDTLFIESGHIQRSILNQSYFNLYNSYYIARGYSFEFKLLSISNQIGNNKDLNDIPDYDIGFSLGIQKHFDRGYFQLDVGYRDAFSSYVMYKALLHMALFNRLTTEISVEKNGYSNETLYLSYGGKKDDIKLNLTYALLVSTAIVVSMEGSIFSTQDDTNLGDGIRARIEFQRQLHSGYPDMVFKFFYEQGIYNKERLSKKIKDKFVKKHQNILPDDFWVSGVSFHYGLHNRDRYTRVWRPYFELIPYYNGYVNQFNANISTGYGGMLFGHDHVSIGIVYDQSVSGTNESYTRFYLNYKKLY